MFLYGVLKGKNVSRMNYDYKDKSTAELIDNTSKHSEKNKKSKRKFVQNARTLCNEYDNFMATKDSILQAISSASEINSGKNKKNIVISSRLIRTVVQQLKYLKQNRNFQTII